MSALARSACIRVSALARSETLHPPNVAVFWALEGVISPGAERVTLVVPRRRRTLTPGSRAIPRRLPPCSTTARSSVPRMPPSKGARVPRTHPPMETYTCAQHFFGGTRIPSDRSARASDFPPRMHSAPSGTLSNAHPANREGRKNARPQK